MITISPSLLASNFMKLEEEIEKLNKVSNIWLHLDIMDGHFVPNLTFGHEIIHRISSKSHNLIDVHLMVGNPSFYIKTLKDENIHNITWHIENTENHLQLISLAKKNFKSVGISLKPSTPVSTIPLEILREIDLVLVMSVEPGFGGQSFIKKSIDKIKELNTLKLNNNLKFIIQVDGGINDSNSKNVIDAGAQNIVAGSFVFNGDINTQIKKLQK
jgi:ribulose-phosphate 3-epimerase